ncbi:hypothetical protein Poli38472_004096 [Pythium oligandrum]|uniref:TKL protein kinase n=1 Tax=Pythium oligandrum TaxID=41045 RepID=A0A8K1FKR2_PYTOL|nr:hypothetical protein Poli38472_004096 [Pythium oligandrum]|eukprot:TMW66331.1 hypothetical protein Poli38472_004096 [Pythium oligandrum]
MNLSIELPPLPKPPIFDMSFNPYFGNVQDGLLQSIAAAPNSTAQLESVHAMIAEVYRSTRDKSIKTQTVNLGGYSLVLFFCLALIIHIRHNRHLALKGDSEAAQKLVLPAYEPLLWVISIITTAYLAIFGATVSTDFFTIKITMVTVEVYYACKEYLYLIVPVFITTQKSISIPALLRAMVITLFFSTYMIPVVWFLMTYGRPGDERLYYWLVVIARALVLVPCAYVCIRPPARASPQTIREFGFFFLVMHVFFYYLAVELAHRGHIDASVNLSYAGVGWAGTYPFFVWRLLRADTEHWRGFGQRAVELQTLFRRNGKMEERISSKGLHVLIEMHRKLIIDFAHLDIQEKIAEGEKSIVFRGTLHSKQVPVAIKMYTPLAMNEGTVAEFSHEAALCGALRHPNVLHFYGMCVCPPTICFVSELCQGSLQLVTQVNASKAVQHHQRQQLLINVGYMLDAARAVAYLHSFSPAFVHRDIRPSNFLVDANGCVKLADFGSSRTLSVLSSSDDTASTTSSLSLQGRKRVLTMPQLPQGVAEFLSNPKRMPEYMAPEIIRSNDAGRAIYGDAADVYALAMTFWDVLYPCGVKYSSSVSSGKTQSSSLPVSFGGADADADRPLRESDIFNMVFAGQRPSFDEDVYPPLRDLIIQGWHTDPRHRPSAENIVGMLEAIQEELCAVLAMELMVDLECSTTQALSVNAATNSNPRSRATRLRDVVPVNFPGTRAVDLMARCNFVASASEGVRMGNMLMDAGFLHHIKHARCFEYSTSLYFFDEDAIQLSQPLAILEEGATSVGQDITSADDRAQEPAKNASQQRQWHRNSDASSSNHHHSRALSHSSSALMENRHGLHCACKKLAQRLESVQLALKYRRRRQKSKQAENLLTTRLLTDDPSEFSEFHNDERYDSVTRMV